MKREQAALLANILVGQPDNAFVLITACQMDGSGWEKTKEDLISLLDYESYVFYDLSFSIYGISLVVYFPTVDPS